MERVFVDCAGDVDGLNLTFFAKDFRRLDCSETLPCDADFDFDRDVDETDLTIFTIDFGKIDCLS